jgi:hypothetical protein
MGKNDLYGPGILHLNYAPIRRGGDMKKGVALRPDEAVQSETDFQ